MNKKMDIDFAALLGALMLRRDKSSQYGEKMMPVILPVMYPVFKL
jgi:hypothetical protein